MISKILSFKEALMPRKEGAVRVAVKQNALERSTKSDTVNFTGSPVKLLNEAEQKLQAALNEKAFDFEKQDGTKFFGTLKEYFESCVVNWEAPNRWDEFFHCTSSKEVGREMIKTGLDWTKTKRMRCGPGTYFSANAMDAKMQSGGGAIIQANYIGKKKTHPIFSHEFYEAVSDNEAVKSFVKQFVDKDSESALNKYCHDLIQNGLEKTKTVVKDGKEVVSKKKVKIDYLDAGSGYGAKATIAVNNDCMKLSPYGWE